MIKNTCGLELLVNGKPVQEFNHKGKTFVESRIGTQYTLKLRNNSWQRVLAVISVDGVNVISGEPESKDGPGYIIPAFQAIDVNGFRQDLDSVGTFKFTQKSRSYCNEKGLEGNNGVIGVAFFAEILPELQPWYIKSSNSINKGFPKTSDWYHEPTTYHTYSSNSSERCVSSNYCSTSEVNDAFGVGTTWGEQKQDKVVESTFNKGNLIQELVLYYASMKGLQKLGVPVKKTKELAFPQAFPGFCKPPRGWNK